MRRLNQRKSLFILFLIFLGCSQIKEQFSSDSDAVFGSKNFAESLVSGISPRWFRQPKKFSLQSDDGEIPKHFFFDVNPEINIDKSTINFVIETPQGSPNAYKIDLLSGQHYMHHTYCELTDAWDIFKEKINTPPYSVGIIPRVFDQLGNPQKVMVFGMEDYYQKNFRDNYFDGRVIGGFIEQVCPKGACLEQTQWTSRLVLIVVQSNNSKFKDVQNIEDLQKVIDWPSAKAFAENGFGHNQLGQKFYPSLKMGALLDAKTAMNFLRSHSIFFTVKKLTKMRNSCYTLYDYLWKQLGEDSAFEKQILAANTKEEMKEINKSFNKNIHSFFYKRFIKEFKKYSSNIRTCMQYIYYGNVHEDQERFWFFTYLDAFSLAYDQGYTYSCRTGSWSRNPVDANGKRLYPLEKEFLGCSSHKIDNAFTQSLNLMKTLKRNNLPSYRFIDYDRGAMGTHNKMYAWVPVSNKGYECSKGQEYYKNQPVIPKDLKWTNRTLEKMKLIKPYY